MFGYNKIMLKIKGLTFLEVVIALFLFTIVLTGFAQRAWVALDANRRSTEEIIATNLRRALMAEIMVKNCTDPQGVDDPGESRFGGTVDTYYDDVYDYNNYNSTADGAPRTINNTLLNGSGGRPNYAGFSWNVTVINGTDQCQPVHTGVGCDIFNASPTYLGWGECKQVTVTVITPRGRDINESQWKINNTP